MPDCDLMIRGGRVVTPSGVTTADVAVTGGRIAAGGLDLSSLAAAEEVDAVGLHAFPGGIDSHGHFNEPGRTEWETVATGSPPLASGGYTAFMDMPLNSQPVIVDGESLDLKLEAATASSLVDFGFWGGLVLGSLEFLEELGERGVMGFQGVHALHWHRRVPRPRRLHAQRAHPIGVAAALERLASAAEPERA